MMSTHLTKSVLTLPLGLILAFSAWATTPEPTSALAYQQTTNTRIVVEENFLRFFTGGSERMTIDADGNVGVGIIEPQAKMHVVGSHHWIYTSQGVSNGWSKDGLTVEANPDTGYSTLKVHSNHSAVSDRGLLNITRQSDELFYVQADGKVGIGTSSPVTSLTLGADQGKTLSTNGITLGSDNKIIEFLHSPSSKGYGTKFYGVDEGAGVTSFRIAVRGNSLDWTDALYIKAANSTPGGTGNIGVGTNTPEEKLHVHNGSIFGNSSNSAFLKIKRRVGQPSIKGIFDNTTGYDGHVIIDAGRTSDAIYLNNYISSNVYMVTGGGNVGIGTTSPSQKLDVNGSINASKYYASGAQAWPDYVFEDTYELSEIEAVEKYIKKNHHLPEIPSATEVLADGIDIVDMQAKLLQKIEELTLYVIELKKENEGQQKEIENLKHNQLKVKKLL